ncbi:MAG: hypothetical protein KatS3mg082_3276 [Nitrospiraceae bacterium]|nr:MAG: hypothetical protein KatS3mg082_3276 [Nitrospiraceae bacterium]
MTLWDQSYVAAALFKSAVAGAVLAGNSFTWDDQLKQQTCWRVLAVGFGTRHYEARAVKIGDWVGAQRTIEHFFDQVRRLIEVDLAVGSLVYRDDETLAFTFPGQRWDGKGGLDDQQAKTLHEAIQQEVDRLAQDSKLETPPLCGLSNSTRSFVPMVGELRKMRDCLAVPVHRNWTVKGSGTTQAHGARHVCPVCLVRFNEPPLDAETENARKSYPCPICRERRRGRLDAWLAGEKDTIWISEVADTNDRVALLSLSFDLEPWLDGTHVDSLRAQSIAEWRRFNPKLRGQDNPVDPARPFDTVWGYIRSKLGSFDRNDPVLSSLQEGYSHEKNWPSFFAKIVEDRADAPEWEKLTDERRAHWLAHQLFRKLPSPGRVHRFWRTAEGFFDELLVRFREISSVHENRWRTRRLLLEPSQNSGSGGYQDRETYLGHWRGAPFEVVYREDRKAFVTICNLARCLEPHETGDALVRDSQGSPILVTGDNQKEVELKVKSVSTPDGIGTYAPVIPLDRSPQRFRVLVPLDRATACIEAAIAKWREEFARVWDRMPLRVGVVAFPRLTPFQAVIEVARNLEEALGPGGSGNMAGAGMPYLRGRRCLVLGTRLWPGTGRGPDPASRRPRRCVLPLCPGGRSTTALAAGLPAPPGARLSPHGGPAAGRRRGGPPESHGGCVFGHDRSAVRAAGCPPARRFRTDAGSVAAAGAACAESYCATGGLVRNRSALSRSWRDPVGRWLPGAKAQWLDLTRAVLCDRLGVSDAALEILVEAAGRGTLAWALEWHLTWLKEGLEGAGS